MKTPKKFHYYKISLAFLARIIFKAYFDEEFEPFKVHIKFSIAPCDLSVNYFIDKIILAEERYMAVYAPSISAEAYLIYDICNRDDVLAKELREFLGNVKYEEDRLASDEMVWMKKEDVERILKSYPDIAVSENDLIPVTDRQIRKEFA